MFGAAKIAKDAVSAYQGGFNLLDAKKESRERMKSLHKRISEIKEDTAYENDRLRRETEREQGASLAKAGASGVKTTSFDDAFLSRDLETRREAAMNRHRARRKINETYDDMRAERRKMRSASRNFVFDTVLGGLSAI